VVAIKRALPSVAANQEFVAMFRDEIRILSRIRHPNVAAALDVVEDGNELLLVMEYIHGLPLSSLTRLAREARRPIPTEICVAIACGALNGLHAVHTAATAAGEPLKIVHRDVSPQNILVGCDGLPRVLDFGVAKAAYSLTTTRAGTVKGKVGYIAPEHLLGHAIDGRADLYGVAVVLWEMLTGNRLFAAKSDVETISLALLGQVPPMSQFKGSKVPKALEAVIRRGLSVDPNARFGSAREMVLALEAAARAAAPEQVGEWVSQTAHGTLVERRQQLAWAENCPLTDAEALPPMDELVMSNWASADDDHTVRDAHFGHDELRADTDARRLAPPPNAFASSAQDRTVRLAVAGAAPMKSRASRHSLRVSLGAILPVLVAVLVACFTLRLALASSPARVAPAQQPAAASTKNDAPRTPVAHEASALDPAAAVVLSPAPTPATTPLSARSAGPRPVKIRSVRPRAVPHTKQPRPSPNKSRPQRVSSNAKLGIDGF